MWYIPSVNYESILLRIHIQDASEIIMSHLSRKGEKM